MYKNVGMHHFVHIPFPDGSLHINGKEGSGGIG